jgi:hypothetical protein
MDAETVFFRGNRVWWSAALLVGPISGALVGDVSLAFVVTGLAILPAFVIFDTDRPWWPDTVRQLPQNSERSRIELRKLTLSSGVALATGVLIALIRPWA